MRANEHASCEGLSRAAGSVLGATTIVLTTIVVVGAGAAGAPPPLLAQTQAPAPAPVTAFVNVSVVPMDRARVLAGQTVVVQGDRIVALGPARRVRVPAGAVRIDGTGQFLIPGLADMHAHLSNNTGDSAPPAGYLLNNQLGLLAYVASGVTTIRNMTGRRWHLTLRDQAARGELLSPRIYSAGPMVDDSNVNSVAAAQRTVAEQRAAGYDFLKLHSFAFDPEVFDSFVAAARRAGMPFAGHAPGQGLPLLHLLAAQPHSLEHLYGYSGKHLWSLNRNSSRDPAPRAALRARAVATRRAGVWNCPTLTLQAPVWLRPGVPLPSGTDSAQLATVLVRVRRLRQIVRALHDAGAGLLVGTDVPAETWFTTDSGSRYAGGFVYQELRNLVAVGLTPYEALQAATRNPAVMLGVQDSVGTVAVGYRADLVLLRGNPLTRLKAVERPAGVMLGGRWFTAAELAARLAALEAQFTALGGRPEVPNTWFARMLFGTP